MTIREFYTVPEMAAKFGKEERYVREQISRGTFPFVPVYMGGTSKGIPIFPASIVNEMLNDAIRQQLTSKKPRISKGIGRNDSK